MKFFIDTANIDQIRDAQELGILDGVTTNPSLMAKEGITGKNNILKHYVDICNIVDGDTWNNSSDFKNHRQTANAEKFIARMKKASYRWGGDFGRVDTPHFDKQLDASSFSYDAKFYLNQTQITSGAPIELQSISD